MARGKDETAGPKAKLLSGELSVRLPGGAMGSLA
jgi:hypothetical protein